jgi:hypothetical protein
MRRCAVQQPYYTFTVYERRKMGYDADGLLQQVPSAIPTNVRIIACTNAYTCN